MPSFSCSNLYGDDSKLIIFKYILSRIKGNVILLILFIKFNSKYFDISVILSQFSNKLFSSLFSLIIKFKLLIQHFI